MVVKAAQVLEKAALGDGQEQQPYVDEQEHSKVESRPVRNTMIVLSW